MKHFIIFLIAALVAPLAFAETLEQRRAELASIDGVLVAVIQADEKGDPITKPLALLRVSENVTVDIFPGYRVANISYLYFDGNAILDNTVAVVVEDATGDANWQGRVPSVITAAAVPKADPLGTDKEILTAVGGNIVKAEITRHPVVGDVAPSATVVGYRDVDGKTVEFKVVVYSKGGVLVSNEPVGAAAAEAVAQ
jgi:hypothetical protein